MRKACNDILLLISPKHMVNFHRHTFGILLLVFFFNFYTIVLDFKEVTLTMSSNEQ